MESRFRSLYVRVTPLLIAVLLATISKTGFSQIRPGQPTEASDSIFVTAPRDTVRPLTKAEEAISKKEYAEAVELLGEVLFQNSEDYLIPDPTKKGKWQSLRTRALQVVANMPSAGREMYELKYGVQAKQLLNQAIAAKNWEEVSTIAATYAYTEAGGRANMLVGRLYLSMGRFNSAQRAFQGVLSDSIAADKFYPEIQYLTAISLVGSGKNEEASKIVDSLVKSNRAAKIRIGSEVFNPQSSSAEAILRKMESVVGEILSSGNVEEEWVTFRGNPQRDGISQAGAPLLMPRWRVPTVLNAGDREIVNNLLMNLAESSNSPFTSFNALAFDDMVIMRTNEHVMGVDLKSGLRTWYYPWDSLDGFALEEKTEVSSPNQSTRSDELQKRLFQDNVYGQLSSDGTRVYFVDKITYQNAGGINRVNRRMAFPQQAIMENTPNVLVALTVREPDGRRPQGKLAWTAGGENGSGLEWSKGVMFLGPPLAVEGQLYVIGEVAGEVRLYVLNPETGELSWSQQIAITASGFGAQERTFAGAVPSFSDGILICPTSSGAIVGIDLASRTLLWGNQYRLVSRPQVGGGIPPAASMRWSDSSPVIRDGQIFLTPREDEGKIHCFNLYTGELVWTKSIKNKNLYIAGFHESNLIWVSTEDVGFCQTTDGVDVATIPLKEAGVVSGRALMSKGKLLVPLQGSKLVSVDLGTKVADAPIDVAFTLGNLVAHNGYVISHGPDWVSAFYQDEPSEVLAATLIAQTPNAADGYLLRGQILLRQRKYVEAIQALLKAYELAPNDYEVQEVLVSGLVLAARIDVNQAIEAMEKVEPLLLESEYKFEYLRAKAEFLFAKGAYRDALVVAIGVAEGTFKQAVEPAPLRLDDRVIAPEQWAKSLFARVAANVPVDNRSELVSAVVDFIRPRLEAKGLDEQLPYQKLISPLVNDFEWEWMLADKLISEKRYLEAEMLLAKYTQSANELQAASSLASLAKIYAAVGEARLAMNLAGEVENRFGAVQLVGGVTGAAWAADLKSQIQGEATPIIAAGQENFEVKRIVENSSLVSGYYIQPISLTGYYPTDISVRVYNLGKVEILDGRRQPLFIVSARDSSRNINIIGGFYRLNGHLLTVTAIGSSAYEIIAIDLFKAKSMPENAVLWRYSQSKNSPGVPTGIQTSSSSRLDGQRTDRHTGFGQVLRTYGGSYGEHSRTQDGNVYVLRGQQLLGLDELTGKQVWKRTFKDAIERSVPLPGRINLIPRSEVSKIQVVSTMDGSDIQTNTVEQPSFRWFEIDSVMVGYSEDTGEKGVITFRGINLADGKLIWQMEVPTGTRATQLKFERIGMLSQTGEFKLIDARTGNKLVETKLALPEKMDFQSIDVRPDPDGFLVLVNRSTMNDKLDSPMPRGRLTLNVRPPQSLMSFNGLIFAINPDGTSRWPRPAVVEKFGLVSQEIAGSPILGFFRFQTQNMAEARPSQTFWHFVAIDKRTGQEIYRDQSPLQGSDVDFVVPFHDREAKLFGYALPGVTVQFKPTNEPLAPAPVAYVVD